MMHQKTHLSEALINTRLTSPMITIIVVVLIAKILVLSLLN